MSNQQSKTKATLPESSVVWTFMEILIGLKDLSVVKLNSLQELSIT